MSDNQPCISETIKLSNGEIVKFANIDMSSYANCGYNTAALRYLKPIIELIGHPVLITVNHMRSDGTQFLYHIYFAKLDSQNEEGVTTQTIHYGAEDTDTLFGGNEPEFDDNIEYYRQYEITAHDAWNLLQKLQEEQAAHRATRLKIEIFLNAIGHIDSCIKQLENATQTF